MRNCPRDSTSLSLNDEAYLEPAQKEIRLRASGKSVAPVSAIARQAGSRCHTWPSVLSSHRCPFAANLSIVAFCMHVIMTFNMSDVTQIIDAISRGEADASAKLLPLIYQELRQLARAQMVREGRDHTLQATALVHEAFLRMFNGQPVRWEGRRHFFAAAAEAMRRILIEHARHKHTLKAGGGRQRIELETDDFPETLSPCSSTDELLALNDALDRLAHEDPERAELIKLLYFAGLSLEDSAAMLGISRSAAYRRWIFARAWLREAISGERSSASVR